MTEKQEHTPMTADKLEALVNEYAHQCANSTKGEDIIKAYEALRICLLSNAPRLIEALRASEWQGMDSAPRDWDDVLVFSPEHEGFNCGGVFSAFYDPDEMTWATHSPSGNIRLQPTAWRPLPAPPARIMGDKDRENPVEGAPLAEPIDPDLVEATDHPVFAYLRGEGQLDGVWFGDAHPSGRPFWWRKHLRDALAALKSRPKPSGEVVDLIQIGTRCGEYGMFTLDEAKAVVAFIAHQERRIEALREKLDQAADNLEAGMRLYDCPGLSAAASIARMALENDHD